MYLAVNDSKSLILRATPSYADVPAVKWSSSDEKIATVDEKGIVTGVKKGKATITVTAEEDPGLTASVTIAVGARYPYKIGWAGSFTMPDNNTVTTAEIPVESNKIQKAWDAKVGNSPIVIVDEYIYTYDGVNPNGGTDNDGTLYKIDKKTGEIVDTLTCRMSSGYYYSYIIYGGGLIYVSSIDKVMAVDPDSFTVLWFAEVPAAFYTTAQFVGNCLVTRGAVLDSTTGEQIAKLEGTYNYSSGVELDGTYYIASTEGIVYAFDTSDWRVKDSVVFRESTEGSQPGVMYDGGRLFWGENGGNFYSIQIDETTGTFTRDSLKISSCGISTVCTPVAASDRVYLAGTKNSEGVIGVFNAASLELLYTARGAIKTIQSTPILRKVEEGGPSIMSVEQNVPAALSYGNYLVVQDYGDGNGSSLWVLRDSKGATNGVLTRLVTIEPKNYAYEQLAFDNDGSLYCTNDEGYLVKYRTALAEVPNILEDLSTAEVTYPLNSETVPLKVRAAVSDGGVLTYQWQSSAGKGIWKAVDGANDNEYIPSSAAVGSTYYRCTITNTLNGQSEQISSKTAKITILDKEIETPVIYGDANGDGKVSAKDVTAMRRYLAMWTGITIDTKASDVDLDGKVTGDDAAILTRYLAGWADVTIGVNE